MHNDDVGYRAGIETIDSLSTMMGHMVDCLLYTSEAADDLVWCRSRWSR